MALDSRISIVVLDDSKELCSVICQLMRLKLGKSCLSASSYEELTNRKADVLASQVAILDINLGENQPSGLDAYNWLREENYVGEVLFYTGHARHNPLIAEVARTGIPVLTKPVPSAHLVSLVDAALKRQLPVKS